VVGVTEEYALGWSGNYYLEKAATAVGDTASFSLYYDLYMESNFYNCIRENIVRYDNEMRAKLGNTTEGCQISWQASKETGAADAGSAYNDAVGAPASLGNIWIRNLIRNDQISYKGDMIRVKFGGYPDDGNAGTNYNLVINSAFIDVIQKVSGSVTEDCDVSDASFHLQLYFRTNAAGQIFDPDTDNPALFTEIRTGGYIPEGQYRYSNWAVYFIEDPLDPVVSGSPRDYFITFNVDASGGYTRFWAGDASVVNPNDRVNSYLHYDVPGDYSNWPSPADATLVDPAAELPSVSGQCNATRNIYALSQLEIWQKTGAVTSPVYDTKIDNPSFNQVRWDESRPSGTSINMKVRSSDDQNMSGATAWSSIAGSTSTPASLAAGTGRYVQFYGVLSTTPFWTCISHSATNVADAGYKSGTTTCSSCGKYLVPELLCPWIDDVSIDWPGQEKLCEISGYFTQKPDYGVIKLTVDGVDLLKGLGFEVTVEDNIQGVALEESFSTEVEPRNNTK
jgi:hypothetical protein